MKYKIQQLKPSSLTILLLLIGLTVQGFLFSTGSYRYSIDSNIPVESVTKYGIGSPIIVKNINDNTSYEISWEKLVINLSSIYLLSLILSKIINKTTQLNRPFIAYMAVGVI